MNARAGQPGAGDGVETDVYGTLSQATTGLAQIRYPALVLDRNLPDGDGLQLVRQLRARRIDTPCLMLTARDALHRPYRRAGSGRRRLPPKPFLDGRAGGSRARLMRRAPLQQSLAPEHGDLRIDPMESRMVCAAESISCPRPSCS
jgi:DNA-binding response OmpR family regulator